MSLTRKNKRILKCFFFQVSESHNITKVEDEENGTKYCLQLCSYATGESKTTQDDIKSVRGVASRKKPDNDSASNERPHLLASPLRACQGP